ncbi:hypothetical protein [Pseudooceanicola atlanticus]
MRTPPLSSASNQGNPSRPKSTLCQCTTYPPARDTAR